jgi:hypothetical protein
MFFRAAIDAFGGKCGKPGGFSNRLTAPAIKGGGGDRIAEAVTEGVDDAVPVTLGVCEK